jgi:hypothetical protein
MTKSFCYIGIAILALAIVVGVLQDILYLLVGGAVFTLESFTNWFWLASAISLAASLILLKYYNYRKYTFTFLIAILSTLATLCQQGLFYLIISGRGELHRYYTFVVSFVLATAIVYALSFIFSKATERKWLRRAGLFSVPITGTLLILIVMSIFSSDVPLKVSILKGIEWIVLADHIVPLFLILNFLNEVNNVKPQNASAVFPQYATSLMGLICMMAFALTLTFGLSVAGESSKHLYWQAKNAEETAKFVQLGEERTFTNRRGETLKYLLVKPKEYDRNTKYPLVVSLPYGGYEASAAQLLASGSNPYRYPAFLFVPFCPEGAGWGGVPNYPTIDTLVFDAIIKLEEEVSIDANRRYVSGVSRGGYGSWHFITTRPDMFAAAIPVCGGGDPQLAHRITDVSVWAFHGALDRNVPVSGSRDMIEAIKKAGGNPKYTEFSDKAHNIWHEVTQTPRVWDWLFEQRKDSSATGYLR